MSNAFKFTLDGKEIEGQEGDTILVAAERNGIYIPRLCAHKDLVPFGSCRVCTVFVNGRPQAACTQPAAQGIIVDNSSEKLLRFRRNIIEMLFVEGNHFCPLCEKSGNCELQALAYRFGILAPKYPYMFPKRTIDATHKEVYLDRNRCVLCGRCVRSSRDLDHKHAFDFVGRGTSRRIAVDSTGGLGLTELTAPDRAPDMCPVGALVRKHKGYAVPIGQRLYDKQPIGSDVESKAVRQGG